MSNNIKEEVKMNSIPEEYFCYQTDDANEFDTLEDAIKYAEKEDGIEVNTITKIQYIEGDDGDVAEDEIVWTREKGKSEKPEATKECLTESQSQEIAQEYDKLSKKYKADLNGLIYGKDGFMKACYPDGFDDFNGDIIYSEKYWKEFKDWLKDKKDITLESIEETIEGTPKAGDYKKIAKIHKNSNKKGARGNNDGFGKPQNTDPKRNMEIFNHMMGSDVSSASEGSQDGECASCGESLVNERLDDYYNEYDAELKKIDATEEEIAKAIKIADEYEKEATKGFITYEQMDKVADEMNLSDIDSSELGRTWELYYDALNREAFNDEEGSTEKYKKYSDAASAFAEVINREARARREHKADMEVSK